MSEEEAENIDYVICKWNNERVKGSLAKYINHRWGKGSWDLYKLEFPDTLKMCEKYRLAISKNSGKHMKLPKYKEILSKRMSGENNINHKSKATLEERRNRSPFSNKFTKYNNDEQVANKQVSDFAKKVANNRLTTTNYDYWLKFTNGNVDEANKLYKERQTTFSLEKLQAKYGKDEGYKRWSERQEKWKQKVFCDELWIGQGKSKICEDFCNQVIEILNVSDFEKEKHIRYNQKNAYKYDLRIKNLIIEFNGDYYHCNPTIKPYSNPEYFNKVKGKTSEQIWKEDDLKIKLARDKGFFVHIVWENDWRQNKERCLQKIKDIHERVNNSSSVGNL